MIDKDVLRILNESNNQFPPGSFAEWFGEDLTGQTHVGDIDCSEQNLTSLYGCPSTVNGNFDCSYNQLTSLEGAPKIVTGNFNCVNNQLTSLQGAPQEVGGSFECSYNQLTSLQGSPQEVGGSFECSYNQLTSLEGSPQEVGGDFNCKANPNLKSLEGIGNVKRNMILPNNLVNNLFNNNTFNLKDFSSIPKEFRDYYNITDITGPIQKKKGVILLSVPMFASNVKRMIDYRVKLTPLIKPNNNVAYRIEYTSRPKNDPNSFYKEIADNVSFDDALRKLEELIIKRNGQKDNSVIDKYQDRWNRGNVVANAIEQGIELAYKEVGDLIKHSYVHTADKEKFYGNPDEVIFRLSIYGSDEWENDEVDISYNKNNKDKFIKLPGQPWSSYDNAANAVKDFILEECRLFKEEEKLEDFYKEIDKELFIDYYEGPHPSYYTVNAGAIYNLDGIGNEYSFDEFISLLKKKYYVKTLTINEVMDIFEDCITEDDYKDSLYNDEYANNYELARKDALKDYSYNNKFYFFEDVPITDDSLEYAVMHMFCDIF